MEFRLPPASNGDQPPPDSVTCCSPRLFEGCPVTGRVDRDLWKYTISRSPVRQLAKRAVPPCSLADQGRPRQHGPGQRLGDGAASASGYHEADFRIMASASRGATCNFVL